MEFVPVNITKIKAAVGGWLKQTSTRAALIALASAGAQYGMGVPLKVILAGSTLPVAFAAIVNDRKLDADASALVVDLAERAGAGR